MFCEFFATKEIPCCICEPASLEYDGSQLRTSDGTVVNLVYRRVLTSELLAKGPEAMALCQAYVDGAIVMVNTFRAKLLHKKMSLALLSDDRYASLYTASELEAIARHIPWTRRLREGRTTRGDADVPDLVEHVIEHRDSLVLKPNDEYGGKGVVLGWTVGDHEWEEAIRIALHQSYVVQEAVPIPREPFPLAVGDAVEVIDMAVDMDPYLFEGVAGSRRRQRASCRDGLGGRRGRRRRRRGRPGRGCRTGRRRADAALVVGPLERHRRGGKRRADLCRRGAGRGLNMSELDIGRDLTIGVEEEFQIIDGEGELKAHIDTLLASAHSLFGEDVKAEMLQSVVEIGTKICSDVGEARSELRRLRGGLVTLLARDGLRLASAGTHPFSHWKDQRITEAERYKLLEDEMQDIVRELLIFGMHIHVGIPDPELRIDVMNEARYFLPHLLALSSSSPFWLGRRTGLKSYRSVVWSRFPRSGIPPELSSYDELENLVELLVKTHCIDNGKKVWWDLRPHHLYPTLEFRVCDAVTRLEEALCLAAAHPVDLRQIVEAAPREPRLSEVLAAPRGREQVAGDASRSERVLGGLRPGGRGSDGRPRR